MRKVKHSAGRQVVAFAPATVANVAVGFDVLGFALEGVGDRVRVRLDAQAPAPVVVDEIGGGIAEVPSDPARNTAAVALRAMIDGLGLRQRFRLGLWKGIPLGSGMGGSAASAVGAVVAANALLDRPLERRELLEFALVGEAAASGAPHADNAAPCLFGGLTAVVASEPPHIIDIPVPPGLACVVVRPELRVDTREARASLSREVPLERFVEQTMYLTGFLAGCFRGDVDLVGRSMRDLVAGPQRAARIAGFDAARAEALAAGALGFAVAGSGPSVFAWVREGPAVAAVRRAVVAAFESENVPARSWVSRLGCPGARVLPEAEALAP
jgi:homoserine kinase